MPTVTLSRETVQKLIEKELPLEELKDRISMLGTDLEEVTDDEIQVEIFPNRPDLLSEQGFSRALASFIGTKTGLREYTVAKSKHKVIVEESVTMRPYTACAIVRNLKFDDERIRQIMQAQEKLATTHGRSRKKSAYGIYPLDKINFPVTYKALAKKDISFKPLGFTAEMTLEQVEEEHPTAQKYKDVAKGWDKYPCFVDAKENIMCLLPYTNSHDTGRVTEQTTEVFVECSGTDKNNVQTALCMFTSMLAEMGGQIEALEIVYPQETIQTPNFEPQTMKLDLEYINKRLGLELDEKRAQELLERMGYGYENGNVLIPAYRNDVLHQVDLIEDIAIAYGYENFEHQIPDVATIADEAQSEKLARKVSEIAIGLGLLEVKSYHLMKFEALTQTMSRDAQPVKLLNALGEHNTLRDILLPSLLKIVSENEHNEYPQNLFEIGRIFKKNDQEETGLEEQERLAVLACSEKADVTQVRQFLDTLTTSLDLNVQIKEKDDPSFIQGRCAAVLIDDEKVGVFGEFHPQVLENWGITMPASGLELNLNKLLEKIKK